MQGSQWVPIVQALKMLGITRHKMNQLIDRGLVTTKDDIRDNRKKLVDIEQARRVLAQE